MQRRKARQVLDPEVFWSLAERLGVRDGFRETLEVLQREAKADLAEKNPTFLPPKSGYKSGVFTILVERDVSTGDLLFATFLFSDHDGDGVEPVFYDGLHVESPPDQEGVLDQLLEVYSRLVTGRMKDEADASFSPVVERGEYNPATGDLNKSPNVSRN